VKAENQKSSGFAGLTESELARLIQQYGCGLVWSSGTEEALYERHLGLTAEQVAGSRGSYNPHWHYEDEPETCAALDLIFSNHFSRNEPGIFEPRDALPTHGDYFMHLADLKS
jgi:hypothetical protein